MKKKNFYSISKFIEKRNDGVNELWVNTAINTSVSVGKELKAILPKLLIQQLDHVETNENGIFLQLITQELLVRGILVPSMFVGDEISYLKSLNPFSWNKSGIFNASQTRIYNIPKRKNLIFIGVPCDMGGSKSGSRNGPQLIRNASCLYNYRGTSEKDLFDLCSKKNVFEDINVVDLGDLTIDRGGVDDWHKGIDNIFKQLPKDSIPFLIGGDHSFTYFAVKHINKTRKKKFTYVHIDAHLDMQIWGDFANDTPDLGPITHNNFVSWIKKDCQHADIVHLGLNNYITINNKNSDNVFKYLERSSSIIFATDISTGESKEVLKKLPSKNDIYLSIDVDVLNASVMNETGFPSPTGIDLSKLQLILDYLLKYNNIVGIDIMEYGVSNETDRHKTSVKIVLELILKIASTVTP